MNLTATQIEDIVRVVVERLRTGVAAPLVQATAITPERNVEAIAGEVTLSERVITLESLTDQLVGTKAILVHPKAVVTPAVKDLLRQKNIRLVRQLPSKVSKTSRPAPLVLVANESSQQMLSKRMCTQQATLITARDAASDVSTIEQHLAAGKVGAVWCSETPYANVAATLGSKTLRAVQLFGLQDLPHAIEQARPNVLILDGRTWNPSAITNLVSNWFRSLS